MIQNWLVSKLFANIFYYLNFAEEDTCIFLFFAKIRNNDFRKNHILILNIILI